MVTLTVLVMKTYVFLLVYASIVISRNNVLYKFTLNILNVSIEAEKCVTFFCEMLSYECDYVKIIVQELNIATVDVTTKRKGVEYFLCSKYYIVISNNITVLEYLFKRTPDSDKWEFKTSSRILIFYKGFGNFDQEEFVLATNKYGYDILVFRNFRIDGPEVFGKKPVAPIQDGQVISLTNKNVIANFNNSGMFFQNALFVQQEWEPIFNNWTFNVAVGDCPPFVLKTKSNRFIGIDIDIVEAVTRNWPVKYVEYNNSVPYQFMQEDLLQDKVNLAVCSQWRESISSRGLALSIPYSQHCTTFLVPKPYIDERISYTFRPIQTECWIIIILASFIVAALMTVYANIYLNLNRRSSYLSYIYSAENSFKLLWMNAPRFPPQFFPAFRIILTFWCLTAMIITTSYSAGYTTVLTYPKLTRIIDNFDDIASQNIHWGGFGDYVKETMAPLLSSEIKRMEKNYFNDCTTDDINRRIRYEKDFAVFVKALPEKYITDIDFLDDSAKTSLRVLPKCAQVNYAVFAFNRNSPFPRIFDKYITTFLECGFVKAWFTRDKHMNYKDMEYFYRIYGEANNTAVALNVKKLEDAFHLLGIGLGFSLIAFLLEILYHKLYRNRDILM